MEAAGEGELAAVSNHAVRLPSRSATHNYRYLASGRWESGLSYTNSVAASVDVELRAPYLDRRVIDFLLAISPRFRFANGLTKVILRQAMAGILPQQVCQRTTFAHFSEAIDYGLREKEKAKVKCLLEGLRISQSKYLDGEKLQSAWRLYYEGTERPSRQLYAPLLLQAWLQHAKGVMEV